MSVGGLVRVAVSVVAAFDIVILAVVDAVVLEKNN